MVDCGPRADVRPGDEVVLLGEQGGERIAPDEWAARLGTIAYEVVCAIGSRVARRYR
jgi:alanine racemase